MAKDITKEEQEEKDPVSAIRDNLDDAGKQLTKVDGGEQALIDDLGNEMQGSGGTSTTGQRVTPAKADDTDEVDSTVDDKNDKVSE